HQLTSRGDFAKVGEEKSQPKRSPRPQLFALLPRTSPQARKECAPALCHHQSTALRRVSFGRYWNLGTFVATGHVLDDLVDRLPFSGCGAKGRTTAGKRRPSRPLPAK